jgi:hypothetical protein
MSQEKLMLRAQELAPPFEGLHDGLQKLLRPAVGFGHPAEVLKNPDLDPSEKRAILSSWASDACAVTDHPNLRWLLGTGAPVPIEEILDALARLDRLQSRLN